LTYNKLILIITQ